MTVAAVPSSATCGGAPTAPGMARARSPIVARSLSDRRSPSRANRTTAADPSSSGSSARSSAASRLSESSGSEAVAVSGWGA